MKDSIIGQKISKVIYSEVNHHDGTFSFKGFDTFDHTINVQMSNGYWWNLGWTDEEYFELGEGRFEGNKYLNSNQIKSWEATERWKEYMNVAITSFQVTYVDESQFIPWRIQIKFENDQEVTILIASELNLDESIPYPLNYEFGGEIYVFFDQSLLSK